MPKEVLVKHEYHGQVWIEVVPVEDAKAWDRIQNPGHMEKGVRQSPFQKDSFLTREPK